MKKVVFAIEHSKGLVVLALLLAVWAIISMSPVVCAQEHEVKSAPAAKTVSPERHKKAEALVAKANTLRSQGKATDAELVLQDAVKLDPNWVTVYVVRAKVYEQLRNYPNAATNWRSAVMLEPSNASYKRCLARAASEAMDWELATDAWREIVKQNPEDKEAVNELASIYFDNGKIEDATQWNKVALDVDPNDAQANLMKGKLELRNRHYKAAIEIFTELSEILPENHPLLSECVNNIADAEKGLRKQQWFMGAIIVIPLIIAVCSILIYRHMQKMAEPEEPVLALESATEDTVCRFLLQYCLKKFGLPRGFCWNVSMDGRHLTLQMSQLIGETSGVAQVTINRKAIADWIEARGTAPFIYETELEDVNFQKSFSFLIKELADININVGVPVVYKGQLYALALLGSSRSERPDKVRKRFSEQAENVQDICEKAGLTLERLGRHNRDVIDAKTGMWNRDYYEESLNNIFRGCRTAQIPLSVFMMRMDQVPGIIEHMNEDDRGEVLYKVAQLIYRGISGEMNITMCHLDNGIFTLIAPDRDGQEAESLAKVLKNCFEKSTVLGPEVRTTGCVVYCVAPDDGNDPVMLRSLLARSFRQVIFDGGNTIKRVEKVEPNKKVEEVPQEELVIRRSRRTEEKSHEYQPFGKARINANADRGDNIDRSNLSNLSNINSSRIVSLGDSKSLDLKTKTKDGAKKLPRMARRLDISTPRTDVSRLASVPTKHRLVEDSDPTATQNADAPSGLGTSAFGAVPAMPGDAPAATPGESNYSLDLKYDEDGVELETQCCSQEVFEELISYELEQAIEEGTSCALVYMRLQNLKDVRSAGRSNYMKLRRELASLLRVFLREDIDIPGLINEDDFAVFMTGTDREAAANLADRLNLTSRNLDAGGYFMIPSLSVVLTDGEEVSASEMIKRAQALAIGEGIHYEGA